MRHSQWPLNVGTNDETLGSHRRQDERGRDHLRHRAEYGETDRGQPRCAEAGCDQEPYEEHHRERQAKQEAHLRRAHRAERADQIALHRVAQRLRARRQKRDRNPNPADGHCQSPLTLVSRSTASSSSNVSELRRPAPRGEDNLDGVGGLVLACASWEKARDMVVPHDMRGASTLKDYLPN
jgi:hypothetical protein